MSLPNFLFGDEVLTNAVSGLHPREKDHDFYFTLEPVIRLNNLLYFINFSFNKALRFLCFKKNFLDNWNTSGRGCTITS